MSKVIIIFVSLNRAIFNYVSVIASFPKSRFILVVYGAKNLRLLQSQNGSKELFRFIYEWR